HGGRGIAHLELVEQCARLTALVRRLRARTPPSLTRPRSDEMRAQAIREAAVVYVRGGGAHPHLPPATPTREARPPPPAYRRVPTPVPGDPRPGKARRRAKIYSGDDVIYTAPAESRLPLDIAKNIIIHIFIDRALVSVALLAPPGPPASRAELRDRVQSLSRLFKLEFMFRADAPFDQIFDEVLVDMAAVGEIAIDGDTIALGPGHSGLDGRGWLAFYSSAIRNFIEGYRIAARAARVLQRSPQSTKELVARALRIGEQMFLGGEIERSEAVSQPVIENAFAAF